MANKLDKVRDLLIHAIEDVKAGTMDDKKATAIAKLAAQVHSGLQVEINAIREMRALGLRVDSDLLLPAPPKAPVAEPARKDDDEDDPPDVVEQIARGTMPSAGAGKPAPRVHKGSRY